MDNCPICNHEVESKDYSGVVDGVVYYFCCKKYEKNFESEPRKYINCCEEHDD